MASTDSNGTPPDFDAYAVGLVYASVCSSICERETTWRLNVEHPTGIPSAWAVADEPFRTGEPNPHPCERAPDTHKHYLFVC